MRSLLAASLVWAFSFGLIKIRLADYDPRAVA
ncbi:EamA family transporter, partial [bacterium]|nr:EamA family transporter [bacterium]